MEILCGCGRSVEWRCFRSLLWLDWILTITIWWFPVEPKMRAVLGRCCWESAGLVWSMSDLWKEKGP